MYAGERSMTFIENDSIAVQLNTQNLLKESLECKPDRTKVAKSPLLKFMPLEPQKEVALYDKNEAFLTELQTKVSGDYDVQKNLFNGSAKDLNSCLKGTKLEGMGQIFIDAQNEYGVNALFLMSIVKVESNYGEAPAKDRKTGVVHKYNIAGLKKSGGGYQDNTSYANCVNRCASALQRLYFNKTPKPLVTISQIHDQYCVGNKKWTKEICEEMNNLSSTILEQYK
jgi:hypothetical protein